MDSRNTEGMTVSFIVTAAELETKFMERGDLWFHFVTVL
jgi:hypothetical protein